MTSARDLLSRARTARREGRRDEFAALVERALEVSRAEGSNADAASALHLSAQLYMDEGRPDAAVEPYEEAVALRRRVGDPEALAHELRHLGAARLELGELDAADGLLGEALRLYRQATGDEADTRRHLDTANAIRPLAILRERQGRAAEARALWEEARELYERAGIEDGVDEAESHLR